MCGLVVVCQYLCIIVVLLFFFNYPATTEIYTLSLHDALPIWADEPVVGFRQRRRPVDDLQSRRHEGRSEEHTSELQSLTNLVCRLLLEKKKYKTTLNSLYPYIMSTTNQRTQNTD